MAGLSVCVVAWLVKSGGSRSIIGPSIMGETEGGGELMENQMLKNR